MQATYYQVAPKMLLSSSGLQVNMFVSNEYIITVNMLNTHQMLEFSQLS